MTHWWYALMYKHIHCLMKRLDDTFYVSAVIIWCIMNSNKHTDCEQYWNQFLPIWWMKSRSAHIFRMWKTIVANEREDTLVQWARSWDYRLFISYYLLIIIRLPHTFISKCKNSRIWNETKQSTDFTVNCNSSRN